MVQIDFEHNKGMYLQGGIPQIAADCGMLISQIYNKLIETCGTERAKGIMFDLLKQSIYDIKVNSRQDIVWKESQEEKLAYTQ